MMSTTTRNLRSYDHRLRELVRSTGDIQHAIHRGVPRSTAHGWLKSPRTQVVTVDVTDMDVLRLQQELLTPDEVETIKSMATSDEHRHVPTGTLSLLVQRLGKVFASSSTWYRLIRIHGWRRPRKRIHPAKPKVGIRATGPNEVWHVDTTLIRLLDGSRAYLHAVIDNFSRRILAWKVSATFDPSATAELLLRASKHLTDTKPTLLVDGGVENFHGAVNELVESWWRVLKHQWLYLNTLDTVSSVRKLVTFYVKEHNTRLSQSAFRGQTPLEMYFGTGNEIPGQLEMARRAARAARKEVNRNNSCPTCEPLTAISS
jgi:putative transposase